MKDNKLLAILIATAMLFLSAGNAFAAKDISGITVTDVDSTVTPTVTQVNWDETYPIGNLAGNAANIKVKAKIEPTLNMALSSDVIDLGLLVPGTAKTGNLDIEVGTNAKNGVVVTVQSQNGALVNTADNTTQLNAVYQYSSTNNNTGSALDSTISGFAVSNTLTATNVDASAHTIYETNKPENNDDSTKDITFGVSVNANAQSQAGSYEDLLTFTITGRF